MTYSLDQGYTMLKYQKELDPYTNKDDLAREVLGHNNFDTALNQEALDHLADNDTEYCSLRFGLVTNYSESNWGQIVPITLDAQELLNIKHGVKL